MKCPHCSQEHPENINFCPLTGKAIIVQPLSSAHQSINTCPVCKRNVKPNQQFCPACGAPLKIQENYTKDVETPTPIARDKLEICPKCSKVLPVPGGRFCPACGSAVTEGNDKIAVSMPETIPVPKLPSVVPGDSLRKGKSRSIRVSWALWGGLAVIFLVIAGYFAWNAGLFGSHIYFPLIEETPTVTYINTEPSGKALVPLPSRTIFPSVTVTKLATNTDIATLIFTQISTQTPTQTPAQSPTSTSTALPAVINPSDDETLIYIPAGIFTMGSDSSSDPYFWGAEAPTHDVFLTEYYIYMLEVTNAQYAMCVAEQQCPRPEQSYSHTRREYYGNSRFDNFPVVYVTYQMASAYCIWAGGRLPSEAEWEKAARSTDKRMFPWGSELPNPSLANYNDSSEGDSMLVGSYPLGASAYGVLDMGGNVIEWTYDLFDESYYRYSSLENPFGPLTGTRRVIRGGSWASQFDGLRTVARASMKPDQSREMLGFRCVVEAIP